NILMRLKDDDWDAVLNANLRGAFAAIRAASRGMMKRRWGRIINIASVVGLVGNKGQSNYAASKAGLIGLTKSVAKELASRNILANAVAPGFIETDMTATMSDEARASLSQQIPLGRLGSPNDIAGIVAFLASEHAAYITGQVVVVDGGMVMLQPGRRLSRFPAFPVTVRREDARPWPTTTPRKSATSLRRSSESSARSSATRRASSRTSARTASTSSSWSWSSRRSSTSTFPTKMRRSSAPSATRSSISTTRSASDEASGRRHRSGCAYARRQRRGGDLARARRWSLRCGAHHEVRCVEVPGTLRL